MLEVSKQYECQNPKCRFRFTVKADPEQGNMLPQPRSCPNKAEIQQSAPQPGSGAATATAAAAAAATAGGVKRKRCQSTNLRELEGSRSVRTASYSIYERTASVSRVKCKPQMLLQ